VVHEDAPHHLGGDGIELRPVLPDRTALAEQAQVDFVHEGRRREGVLAPFTPQVAGGRPSQLGVNEAGQLLPGLRITLAPGAKQSGHADRRDRLHGLLCLEAVYAFVQNS
jgi:hypothetical protein